MALWGDKDDLFSSGTVSVKLAGINTYYADGLLVEKSAGINISDSETTPGYTGQVVFEVIGSIGAGAGTSFGKGVGFAQTGDILKFGEIIGGTYYGSGIIVGIASTGLCYIASTEGFASDVKDADLAGVEYTINDQPTYVSGGQQERWSQQGLSDAETTDAGRVGLAYSVSVAAASTTQFVLDGAYTDEYDVDGKPRIRVGDTLSTYSGGVWSNITTLTAINDSAKTIVWTTTLTGTTAGGVSTVSVADTTPFNVGDTVTCSANASAGPVVVNRIGLSTIGFTGNLTAEWTSGNRLAIGRTVSNVATGSASIVSVAATDTTLRVTRSSGADKRYIAGVSTYGSDSSQGTIYEVAHGGWVGVTSYFDGDGNLRVKTETLVAMSGIATGNNPVIGPDPAVS
jgi:hypothetical protein